MYEGSNRDALISGRLPMTIVTAIVSPTARPKPSMIAPAMPGAPPASTTRVVSQRVAPKASAASRCETGTAASTSRMTAETIGVTMIASMTPPVRSPRPVAVPRKSGSQPNQLCKGGSTCSRMKGASTKMPHSP